MNRSAEITRNKRKSFDIENENLAPNDPNSARKTRLRNDPVEPQSITKSKLKSGLPRLNSIAGIIAKPTKQIGGPEKRKGVAELNTAERSIAERVFTPSNHNQRTPISRDQNFSMISSQSKMTSSTYKTSNKIRLLFENAFSISDETVSTAMAQLRVKSNKWEMKEKMKKYEIVIRELKDGLNTLLNECKILKDSCISEENDISSKLSKYQRDLDDVNASFGELLSSESRLKKDTVKLHEELNHWKGKADVFSQENSSMSAELDVLRKAYKQMDGKLQTEESLKTVAENKLSQLEKEFMCYKMETSGQLVKTKDQYEQKIEQIFVNSKQDIENLRTELTKKQSDTEKSYLKEAELDRKYVEMREENFRLQSELREAETWNKQYEREVERLSSELTLTKEHTILKETDLRSTLASLSELQRQSAEDKSELKAELSILQARVKLFEEEKFVTSSELSAKREECMSTIRELNQCRDQCSMFQNKINEKELESVKFKDCTMQLEVEKELRSRCEFREEAERRERIAACAQLIAIQSETQHCIKDIEAKMKVEREKLELEFNSVLMQRDDAMRTSKEGDEMILGLQSEVQHLKSSLNNALPNLDALQELSKASGELEILRKRIRDTSEYTKSEFLEATKKIHDLEDQIKLGEMQRRKLHNLVQELRGNVRVFARIRPFLPNDGFDMCSLPEPALKPNPDGSSLKIVKKTNPNGDEKIDESTFGFDRVFGPSYCQENIFTEVSEFVQSALDGFNVCLFSYGQTGSGKTHTMQGSGTGTMRGIIPRAVEQVGIYKTELEKRGWVYQMEVSFVEIYNETIRDLIRSNANDDSKHEIKKDASGNTYISDVTMISVDPNDTEQINDIIELAARHRSVGQTAMNERSSRSHSIFTLHMRASNEKEATSLKSTLNLVDLAGSERIDRSGVTGSRLKESVAINKSLSALTDVFVAIGNKQSHVPFRNSKLTFLLQTSLSGDGKTLMLVNLSPTEESFHETLCSLRFASQVNKCELGKPKKQTNDYTLPQPTLSATATPTTISKSSQNDKSATPREPPKKLIRK